MFILKLKSFTIVVIILGLTIISCEKTGDFMVEDNIIYFQNIKFQVLTPTMVRIQQANNGEFSDFSPDLGIVNTNFEKTNFTIDKFDSIYIIKTDSIVLTYNPNRNIMSGGVICEGVNKALKILCLNEPDTLNLGGVIESIDNCLGNKRFSELTQNDVAGDWHYRPEKDGILSKRGWTLLSHKKDTLELYTENSNANDLYLMLYGDNYKNAFMDFYQLAGSIPMLPKWSLGFIYSRWKNYSANDLKEIVLEFRKQEIPIDAIIADMSWHVDGWYGYRYDTINFPDMKAYHAWMDSMNVRTGFNHHSGEIYANDPRVDLFCERIGVPYDSVVEDGPSWLPGTKVVKYNPSDSLQFNTFYELFVDQLLKDGVDFHWVDGYKTIHSSHNYYEKTKQTTNERSIVLNRLNENVLANHRYPIGFSGDTYIGWETLEYSIEVTIKGSNCGVYWSHDIGGYMPQGPAGYEPDEELLARWIQLGAFSPVFRMHAKNPIYWTPVVHDEDFDQGSRLPWEWGKEMTAVARDAIQLRYNLMPYLYTLTQKAHKTGIPMIAGMYINYPEFAEAYGLSQFMVGESIIVAPFIKASGGGMKKENSRSLWLPPGTWYDYFSGEKFEGPGQITTSKTINEFPVYVKSGSIIPRLPYIEYANKPTAEQIIEIYNEPNTTSSSFLLYEDDGITYDFNKGEYRFTNISYTNKGDEKSIIVSKPDGNYTEGLRDRYYTIVMKQVKKPESVMINGAKLTYNSKTNNANSWSYGPKGLHITCKEFDSNSDIKIKINNR